MNPKTANEIKTSSVNQFKKGKQELERGNNDYAITLLKMVVIAEPGFLEARDILRKAEYSKQPPNVFKKALTSLNVKKSLNLAKASLTTNQLSAANKHIENALALEVTLPGIVVLAEIGSKLDAKFIVAEACELAILLFQNASVSSLKKLAGIASEHNLNELEIKLRRIILKQTPGDLNEKKLLGDASARNTIDGGNWESKDDFTSKLKDNKNTQQLNQKDRTIRTLDDASLIIESHEETLKKDPNDITALRELGDIYYRTKEFKLAIEYLNRLQERKDVLDTFIDKKIERAEISIITNKIGTELSKEDAETQILELKFNNAKRRIEALPHDLDLRFDIAVLFYNIGEIDAAIEQFQVARNSISKKVDSTIYIGRCFIEKKQYDIAIEQFNEAEKIAHSENDELTATYYKGIANELTNNDDEASKCFKKIYSKQSTFMDIAERIKKYY